MRFYPSRVLRIAVAVLACGQLHGAQAPRPAPVELVRKTVQNEMDASKNAGKFMFRQRKQMPRGSETKLIVETRDAMAGMLVAINDQPPTADHPPPEDDRVNPLPKDPQN